MQHAPPEQKQAQATQHNPLEHASFPAALALAAAMLPAAFGMEGRAAEPPPRAQPAITVRLAGERREHDADLEALLAALPQLPPGIARPDLPLAPEAKKLQAADKQPGAGDPPPAKQIKAPGGKEGEPQENGPFQGGIPGVISNPESLDTVGDWLRKGAVMGLGILGAIAAFRGSAKVYQHFKEKWDARQNFNNGIWFDSLSCNMHTFSEVNGKLDMDVYTFATPLLDTFIPNQYAKQRFLSAAEDCTEYQPFPTLHYSRDRGATTLAGLNRMNRFFKDSFSALYHEDIIAASVGLPTQKGTFFVIPVCEVFRRNGKEFRQISIAAVDEASFARFGSSDDVARMEGDTPDDWLRIKNLQLAHYHYEEYKKLNGEQAELFPKVTVVIRK